MNKQEYLKAFRSGAAFAAGYLKGDPGDLHKMYVSLDHIVHDDLDTPEGAMLVKQPKKKQNRIPGGVRAQRERERMKVIWPYIAHAIWCFSHAFEKGASSGTQRQYVILAQDIDRPIGQGKKLKFMHITEKEVRRCLIYYAKKGALTQVGTSQFFRKGW